MPSNRRPFRSVALALAAAGLVAAGVWGYRRGTADPPVTFQTVRVDRGPVEQAITATGSVSAVVTVQVGSQISGVISKLGADFNARVTEGQVVAQIDPTRFRANLAQVDAALKVAQAAEVRARVNVAQAKIDLDRSQALAARQVVGAAELDGARTRHQQALADQVASAASVAQARAAVGMARVDLERTTIRAPISGVVLQRSVDVGQTVAASLQAPVLFTIAQDLSRMEVRAAIDEADVGKIREGQEAAFVVDAFPGETFRATIFQVRSQPNVVQNVVTYDAILRFDNPGEKLRPGMTATARVVSSRKESVLRVPNGALRFKPAPELVEAAAGGRTPENAGAGGEAGGRGTGGGGRAGGGDGLAAAEAGGRGAGRAGAGGRGRGAAAAGRTRARVYRPAGQKVAAVPFKPGISDDEFTEVLSGALQPGDEVVIDVTGGPPRSGSAASGGPGSSSSARRPPRLF